MSMRTIRLSLNEAEALEVCAIIDRALAHEPHPLSTLKSIRERIAAELAERVVPWEGEPDSKPSSGWDPLT